MEKRNLVDDPAYQEVLEELRGELRRLMLETGDPRAGEL